MVTTLNTIVEYIDHLIQDMSDKPPKPLCCSINPVQCMMSVDATWISSSTGGDRCPNYIGTCADHLRMINVISGTVMCELCHTRWRVNMEKIRAEFQRDR